MSVISRAREKSNMSERSCVSGENRVSGKSYTSERSRVSGRSYDSERSRICCIGSFEMRMRCAGSLVPRHLECECVAPGQLHRII